MGIYSLLSSKALSKAKSTLVKLVSRLRSFVAIENDVIEVPSLYCHPQERGTSELGIYSRFSSKAFSKAKSTLVKRDSRLHSFVAIENDVIEVPSLCCHPQERGTSELGIYSRFSSKAFSKAKSTLVKRDSRLRSFVAIENDVIEVPSLCCHPQERGTSELGIYSRFSSKAFSKAKSTLVKRDSRLRSFVSIGNVVIEVTSLCCHPQERGTSELGIYSLLSKRSALKDEVRPLLSKRCALNYPKALSALDWRLSWPQTAHPPANLRCHQSTHQSGTSRIHQASYGAKLRYRSMAA
ncbi:hypothetical protein VSVS12_00896 [Vibrio scophthalmi]|nr:hypothetical protein VSVS12_00896 [Vibrio scophthalmi]